MISVVNVPVQLKVNAISSTPVDTGQIFTKNDNHVCNFVFSVKKSDNTDIDYSEVTSAKMLIKIGVNYVEPLICVVNSDSISANIVESALGHSGVAVCQLKIIGDSDQVFTTNSFSYSVQSPIYSESAETTTKELSLVNLLLKKSLNGELSTSPTSQTTSVEYPTGGLTDQVLAKASNANNDVKWMTLPSSDTVNVGTVVGIELVQMTNTTATINSGVYYVWGEVESLTIALNPPPVGYVGEYNFQFTSGDIATTIIPIDGVTWYGGAPLVSSNKTYQISIVNGIGISVEV